MWTSTSPPELASKAHLMDQPGPAHGHALQAARKERQGGRAVYARGIHGLALFCKSFFLMLLLIMNTYLYKKYFINCESCFNNIFSVIPKFKRTKC